MGNPPTEKERKEIETKKEIPNITSEETKEHDMQPKKKKVHSMSVCMVPPTDATEVWEALTKARVQLRDPGLYRWPPHANLLYPFLQLNDDSKFTKESSNDSEVTDVSGSETETSFPDEMLDLLKKAVEKCEPFHVSLDTLGTFGGKRRGVLWMYPRSYRIAEEVNDVSNQFDAKHDCNGKNEDEPLIQLQTLLENGFPECDDQRKHGEFNPHMTLSHFECLDDALCAQHQIENWWTSCSFVVKEIYVLKRKGDGGQFKIAACLPLGSSRVDRFDSNIDNERKEKIKVYTPPVPFSTMPSKEEEWVREERMKLKQRRNRKRGGRNRSRHTLRGRSSKSKDTPEQIAAKRAERAAKRERIARESAQLEIDTKE